MGSKLYGAEGRGDVLNFDPSKLKVVTDPKHPLYDERVELPIDEAMVKSIMRLGVREPLIIRRDGDDVYVVDGRQRRANAIEANRRLAAEDGDPIYVPCVWWGKGDNAKLYEVTVATNELRTASAPMERARKMARLIDMGRTEDQLAVIFGVTKQTVKATLALLDCAPKVQKAVAAGLPVTVAAKLSKLAEKEQVAQLGELEAVGATRGKAAKKALAAKKEGKPVEKPQRMRSRAVVERFAARLEHCDTMEGSAVHCALLWLLGDDKALEYGAGPHEEVRAAALEALS